MAGKRKWYVVWVGANPGIYENWAECKAMIQGFPGAKYKSYETMVEAQRAFREGVPKTINTPKAARSTSNGKEPRFNYERNSQIILPSMSVDAACSGNPGTMEYRGVVTKDGQEIFRKGPFKMGTNNIGEFLALVHGLAYMKAMKNERTVIYTDSKTAMAWVRNIKVKTTLVQSEENAILFELLKRGEKWLRENKHRNPIHKWDTKNWGEIPADFGRK